MSCEICLGSGREGICPVCMPEVETEEEICTDCGGLLKEDGDGDYYCPECDEDETAMPE